MEIETPHKQPPTNPTSHPEGVPNPEYIVEKILERKIVNNQKLYLVKWEGYPETDSTWEPVENLLKVLDLIVDFEVRDCFLDSNMNDENPQSSEASPSNPKKRRPDQSLSEEEDITKKIKGENKEPEEEAKRKKSETLGSNRSKFMGDTEFDSPGKLKKVAARVDMSKPFIIGLVEAKPSEYINEEAAAELKKKRGRPKKAGNESEVVLLKEAKSEKSENSNLKKRGRPPKSLLKLLKKRGRPRKYPVVPAVEESVVVLVKEDSKGGDVVKRSRGRPKKIVEELPEHVEPIEQEEHTAVENWIGGEEKVGNGDEMQVQTKKGRGRPRKTEKEEEEKEEKLDFRVKLIIPPREKGKRGRPKKNSEIIVEGAEELEEEGQEGEMIEEEKEGELEVEEKEKESHEMDAFKKARTEAVLKRRGLPVPSENEGKEEGHNHGGEEGKKRGRGRPKKIRDEGEAVIVAEEKKVVEENNKTTPRKRGRPRKDQNVENIEGEEKEEQQEQQEGEIKNEGDETSQNTLISEGQGAQRKGRGRPPKPKDMEVEKGKGVVVEKQKENGEEANNGETQQQAKKRGRPRKIQPETSKENENSNSGQDDNNKEDADEEAKKSEKSQGQDSRKSSFSSSISDQEDEEEDNKASIEEEDEERKPTELTQLNQKAGSFEAHDKPKRIIKMRVLTNTGSLFLVEWETRQNGQQPDNSYVSSYQLKNHCPEFLAEFYEGLIQENFNKLDDIKKAAYKKPSEEFIAVEQKPDAFGGLIFHDRPKSVVKIQSLDEKDMELLIKWHLRYNSVQPLDSMTTSEALKAHELPFLLTYYESKIRAQPGNEKGAVIDIPEKVELGESPIKKEKEKEASINKMEGEALLMEVGI